MRIDELIAALEATTAEDLRRCGAEFNEVIATEVWGHPTIGGNAGHPKRLLWWHGSMGYEVPPDFTRSVDAALTLILEGWWLADLREWRTEVNRAGDTHDPTGRYKAGLQRDIGGNYTEGEGATLVVALCVAALKTRRKEEP